MTLAGKVVLVTGARGFIGSKVCAELRRRGATVLGLGRTAGEDVDIVHDLTGGPVPAALLTHQPPDSVIHLAGVIHGSLDALFAANLTGARNLFETLAAMPRKPRAVMVGSASQFGATSLECFNLDGEAPQRPLGDYGASKTAACAMARAMSNRHGIDTVTAIPFNVSGPGQPASLVPSAFASQIAEIEMTGQPGQIGVGNLGTSRDVTDVRDVARAICDLTTAGEPGHTYSVASGIATKTSELLDMLVAQARVPVTVVPDPARTRQEFIPFQCGDSSELFKTAGWRPEIELVTSLRDCLDVWRSRKQQPQAAGTGSNKKVP